VEDDLNPNEVFLEYVLDDPNSFCLSISRKGAYLWVLPVGRTEIQRLTQQFVDEVRAKGAGIDGAKQLYAWLLKPIPEAATINKFVIAPDGILNLLPFEALRDTQGEYLLKSHVISYVPSGTILDVLRRAKTQPSAPRPFLGVGDVAYENQGNVGRKMPAQTQREARFYEAWQISRGYSYTTFPKPVTKSKESVKSPDRNR